MQGRPHTLPPALALLALLPALPAAAQDTLPAPAPAPPALAPVEVVAVAPLPGQAVDRRHLPYLTHVVERERREQAPADTLTDFLNRHLPGVQVNDIQGSPFQGDLTYRGFRASPLLGAAQGLSVYVDGVRVNEPFGDVVSWELIPEFSVSRLALVSAANPAFGLNTLGGALAFTTHSGLDAPGLRAELEGGSFGRRRADLAHGREYGDGWHSYLAGRAFAEDGWRDASDGNLGTALARLGRRGDRTDWDLALQLGRSRLVGNGLVPAYTLDDSNGALVRVPDLYAFRRESVYTSPDRTRNRLGQLTFTLHHHPGAADTVLSALAYARHSRRDTVNGDEAEDPAPGATAAFNTTATRQTSEGAALSLAGARGPHHWQLGASLDSSRTRYRQLEQEGTFAPDRSVRPGATPAELDAAVTGRALALGLYGTGTRALQDATHLTATLRYNHARVSNRLTRLDDATGAARERPEERFRYDSLNPALGLTHQLPAGPVLFANLARNNRVPTVIELGCADPDEPCRLPVGLQADPYLKQVVSYTAEAGMRWPITPALRLQLAAYRTDNHDDILFRSVSVTGQAGYFANFPRTRHQGLDTGLEARLGTLLLHAGYSYLEATYEAAGLLRQGERNLVITPGTAMAGLPRHSLKLAADWQARPGWWLGGDAQAVSRRGTAGNEDRRHEDGSDTFVDLRLPGYAVLNLRTRWRPAPGPETGWEFFARMNNALDRRYATFAALAETMFTPTGAYDGDERDAVFVAPGAPRSVFAGLRWRH